MFCIQYTKHLLLIITTTLKYLFSHLNNLNKFNQIKIIYIGNQSTILMKLLIQYPTRTKNGLHTKYQLDR